MSFDVGFWSIIVTVLAAVGTALYRLVLTRGRNQVDQKARETDYAEADRIRDAVRELERDGRLHNDTDGYRD